MIRQPKNDSSIAQRLLVKVNGVEAKLRAFEKAKDELLTSSNELTWELRSVKDMLHRWMHGDDGGA